jgi:anti-sigma B factor antagonist
MIELQTYDTGDRRVLKPATERIDASNALAFRDACRAQLASGTRTILDLSAVRFIDSSGLGALVSLGKHLGTDGEMRLVVPHASVRALFEITRIDRILAVHASTDQAFAA